MGAKIEGLDRLNRRLRRIPQRMRDDVKPALNKSADELVDMMRRLAPKDDGDLIASIRREPGAHELQILVKAGDDRAFYARMVEFGTSRSSARPFFYPSYRASRGRIRSRISRAVKKAVRAPA